MAGFPRLVRNSQLGVVDRADDFFPEGLALLDHRALLQFRASGRRDRPRAGLVGLALDEAVVEVDPRRPALWRRSGRGSGRAGRQGWRCWWPPGRRRPWTPGSPAALRRLWLVDLEAEAAGFLVDLDALLLLVGFLVDFAAVLLFVLGAAKEDEGTARSPAIVESSPTARSTDRARMGLQRVNRTLWRDVNACMRSDPLTIFVNRAVLEAAQFLTHGISLRTRRRARLHEKFRSRRARCHQEPSATKETLKLPR